jgi:hypothetical protein
VRYRLAVGPSAQELQLAPEGRSLLPKPAEMPATLQRALPLYCQIRFEESGPTGAQRICLTQENAVGSALV